MKPEETDTTVQILKGIADSTIKGYEPKVEAPSYDKLTKDYKDSWVFEDGKPVFKINIVKDEKGIPLIGLEHRMHFEEFKAFIQTKELNIREVPASSVSAV